MEVIEAGSICRGKRVTSTLRAAAQDPDRRKNRRVRKSRTVRYLLLHFFVENRHFLYPFPSCSWGLIPSQVIFGRNPIKGLLKRPKLISTELIGGESPGWFKKNLFGRI